MNPNDQNHEAHDTEALRQELLEFYFDCHPDPAGMTRRLAEDEKLRELYDEVSAMGGLLDVAAKDVAPPLELEAPAEVAKPRKPRSPLKTMWKLAAAAAVLALLPVFGIWGYRLWQLRHLEDSKVRLLVSAPPALPDGSPLRFHIETYNLANSPLTTDIDWTLYDQDGTTLSSAKTVCDGSTDITVGGRLVKPRKLVVTASIGKDYRETVTHQIRSSAFAPLVHLWTDKPAYRPGEPVMTRVACLDRLTLRGIERGGIRCRITNPQGAVVHKMTLGVGKGVAAVVWPIPANAVGGNYAFEVRDLKDKMTLEKLSFLVRRFQTPQLRKKVTLDRETYAMGDDGNADLVVERVTGGPAAGAKVHASLVIDGKKTWETDTELDAAGRAAFRFRIPADVERGAARFVARVTDGSVVETELEPFVVPTDKVEVAFYPEGGDLIVGTESRCYAQVTDALGRPVSGEGRIVDDQGKRITAFRTEHMGRARFALTPEAGRSYKLEMQLPFIKEFDLPKAKATGVALRTLDDVVAGGQPLRLSIAAPGRGPWIAAAFCRGVLVGQRTVLDGDSKTVELPLVDEAAGVLRVTVFDRELKPVAERLFERDAKRRLIVSVKPEHERVAPGGKQKLAIRTTDEDGRPVSSIVGLAVSDQSVADMLGFVRTGLVDQYRLWTDVEQPDDKSEEFTAADKDYRRNIDLLLGSLGWRRYVWRDKPTDESVKALVAKGGEWARSLPMREGRSWAPAVTDTLYTHRAELWRADRLVGDAWGWVERASVLVFLGLFVLGLVSFVAVLGRRSKPIAVMASVAGVVLMIAFVSKLGSETKYGLDFIGGAAARPGARTLASRTDAEDALITQGFDQTYPHVIYEVTSGSGGGGDVTSFYGIFYDDGLDGDFRARTENYFRSTLSTGYIRDFDVETALGAVILTPSVAYGGAYRGPGDVVPPARLNSYYFPTAGSVGLLNIPRTAPMLARLGYRFQYNAADTAARQHFIETLFWKPMIVTDDAGKASVEFDVSDKVATWAIHADAHGGGRVGQAYEKFESFLPFRIEPKLPQQLTVGDVVELPVAVIADDASKKHAKVGVIPEGKLSLEKSPGDPVELSGGRGRAIARLVAQEFDGSGVRAKLTIRGQLQNATDDRIEHVEILPRGFPHAESRAGSLAGLTTTALVIPDDAARRNAKLAVRFYPSPLATIEQGLQGILRKPHGCFEQASSSNYPNVMALRLMQANGDNIPSIAAMARGLLPDGYRKITGYECSKKGYEWWGKNPGHAALTAYGLMQFHDMSQVYDVDQDMVARTRQWLLDKRDGKGGFVTGEGRYGHFWGGSAATRSAYIALALLLAGEDPASLETEIAELERRAKASDDAYELAVLGYALTEAKRPSAAAVLERLTGMQEKDGSLLGKGSITGSGKRDLRVETTSFAVLAWLHSHSYDESVQRAVRFLEKARTGSGTFGATQATIMALKALTAYAQATTRNVKPGVLILWLNGKRIASRRLLGTEKRTIAFEHLGRALVIGNNELRMELTGGNEFPWSLELGYRAERPQSSQDCALALSTSIAKKEIAEGDTTAIRAVVRNTTNKPVANPMIVLGLPAGLHVTSRVLDDLKKAETIAAWELSGREVILYLRGLEAAEQREIVLDVTGRVPGKYTGQASRAYLYYSDQDKVWNAPLTVTIHAAR